MAVLRFHITLFLLLILLTENEIYAADEDGESKNTSAGELEACKTDLTIFLPPPYQNTSYPSCLHVWNNFMLRVRLSNLITNSTNF